MLNKITKLIFSLCLSLDVLSLSAQDKKLSVNDTAIILDKSAAKKILEEYKNSKDLHEDLGSDLSKEGIITDRPHVAETPFLVPKSYLQWESGFQFQKSHTANSKATDFTYTNLLIRIGFSRRVEGRIMMNYLGSSIKINQKDSVMKSTGFSGISLGSKVFLFNSKGLRPTGTILYMVALPFPGTKTFRPTHTTMAEIMFLFVNRVTRFYDFEYNLGVQWDETSQGAAYAYAFNNEFALSEKLFLFAEIYGYFYEQSDSEGRYNGSFQGDHRANGGIYYRLSRDWQIDFSGGVGLSKISPDYYLWFGLSNRIGKKKRSGF
jgi:hypothetical protein